MKRQQAPRLCARVILALLSGLVLGSAGQPQSENVWMTTEDLVRESDLIVLGRVTSTDPDGIPIGPTKQLFTRHTLKVETYLKGSGLGEVSLLTRGGIETRVVGNQVRRTFTVGGTSTWEGARVGEELLAFLKAVPEGYVFSQWDTARCPVYLFEAVEGKPVRSVNLTLRKKKYMRGGALQGFQNLERREGGPDASAKVEEMLKGTKGLQDVVPVSDLPSRIAEIIRGHSE